MKKFILLAAVLIASCLCANAQRFNEMFKTNKKSEMTFGIRTGYNVSNVYGTHADNDAISGGHIYGFIDIPITNGLYIQTGLQFMSKGSGKRIKESNKDVNGVEITKYVPVYLELPILASFRADISSDINLQLGVGQYVGVAVGGQYIELEKGIAKQEYTKYRYKDYCPLFSHQDKTEINYNLHRFDTGITIQAGLTFFEHLYAGMSYEIGVINLVKSGVTAYSNNGCFAVSVGYTF